MWIKSTSFNVWVRYFVWNFKGTLWNSTQNIFPIHWKIWFLCNFEILRALSKVIQNGWNRIKLLCCTACISPLRGDLMSNNWVFLIYLNCSLPHPFMLINHWGWCGSHGMDWSGQKSRFLTQKHIVRFCKTVCIILFDQVKEMPSHIFDNQRRTLVIYLWAMPNVFLRAQVAMSVFCKTAGTILIGIIHVNWLMGILPF